MDGEIISKKSKFDRFAYAMSPDSLSFFYVVLRDTDCLSIVNHTLSIDMSKSWTNDSVPIRVLDKGNAPQLNKQVLWPSSDNETFFAFGGEESYLDNPWYPPDILLWQFTADGGGGGKWDVFNPSTDSIFFNLTRPTDGLAGVVDNTGYIVGGYTNSHSSIATDYQMDNIEIPNIASFNITSGEWNNGTAPAYLERQNGTYGMIHPVPTFGPAGLLAMTGTTFTDGLVDPLSNITLYEPSGKTWYTQTASGDIPNGRDHPCTVGVRGDNGTYEMYVDRSFTCPSSIYQTNTHTPPRFMYGGHANPTFSGNMTTAQVTEFNAYDEVYILSLPAFAWFKAPYPAVQSRQKHTCEVFGGQMLSIGGYSTTDNNLGYLSTDRFLQGLGIFDLTALQWKSSYNATADAYRTSDVVKAWYRENGTAPAHWDDPAVRSLFEKASPANPGSESGTASGSPGTGTSPSPSPPSKPSSHTGAIAAGVVGGVVGLALLAGLIFWFLRSRRRRGGGREGYSAPKEQMPEMEAGKQRPAEMPDSYRVPELGGSAPTVELEGRGKNYLRMGRTPLPD